MYEKQFEDEYDPATATANDICLAFSQNLWNIAEENAKRDETDRVLSIHIIQAGQKILFYDSLSPKLNDLLID